MVITVLKTLVAIYLLGLLSCWLYAGFLFYRDRNKSNGDGWAGMMPFAVFLAGLVWPYIAWQQFSDWKK